MKTNTALGRAILVLLTVGAALLLFQLAVGLLFAPPGHDGSYYLAHSRYVARGLTPYADFPTPYAPGPYYLNAMVGERGLADPVLGKVPMYLANLANCGLLCLIFLRLGHSARNAWFGTVLFGLWAIVCGADRMFLEPFQNACALLGFAILLHTRSLAGCVAAGLAAGAALMMKQLSLPIVPGLLLLALAPTALDGAARSWTKRLLGAALFLVSVGGPFLLFVLVYRLDFATTFKHVASFGGGGGSYGAFDFRDLFASLVEKPTVMLLPVYPCSVLGVWLLVRVRTWETASIVVLFTSFLTVMLIQTHAHYIQLCAPWGVLILAESFRRLELREGEPRADRILLAVVLLCWFLPGVLSAARESVRYVKNRPYNPQHAIAEQVKDRLPSRDNVLIVNAPWIYLQEDITPPKRNHDFIRGRDLDAPWVLDLARSADYAVVVPYGHTGRLPMDKAKEAMEKCGLTLYDSLPVDTEILGDERSLPDAKILFYRRETLEKGS